MQPTGAALGTGTIALHPECKSIYLPPFYGATGGSTENGPPVLADTAGPAGQKTAWGASRQKSDNRTGRAEEVHQALKDTPRRVQKTPPSKKTQDVATRRRESTATDALGDTAMTATDAIRNTAMTTATEATRDTAMPDGAVAPPMLATPSRSNRAGAATGVVARATDVGFSEKTLTWTATVAPVEKETSTTGCRPPVCPEVGSETVAGDQAVERPVHQGRRLPHVSAGKSQRALRRERRAAN